MSNLYHFQKLPWYECILIAIMLVVNMVPYLSRNMSLIIQFIILIYIPSVNYKYFINLEENEKKTMYFIFLYICIGLLYRLLGISSASLDNYFTSIKFFWLFIVFLLTKNLTSVGQIKFFLITILFSYIYTIYTNYRYSIVNDHYITMFLNDPNSNAANTGFASCSLLFSGIFVTSFFSSKSKTIKLSCISLLIISYYYLIFIAERGTTFILALMMFVVMFFNRNIEKNNSRLYLTYIILAITLVLFFTGLLSILLELISGLLPERIGLRMLALSSLFSGTSITEVGYSVTGRYELMLRSINTFIGSFSNFIFGVGDDRPLNIRVGCHSEWIDTFARYGIFGGTILLYTIGNIFSSIRSVIIRDKSLLFFYDIIFLFFFIRGILGNVLQPSIGTVMFFALPCTYRILYSNKLSF